MDTITDQHITQERRAIFLPYLDENPYQDLLSSALSKQGISVIKQKKLRIFSTLLNRVNVVHLHWLPNISRKRYATVRMWLFCCRLFVLRCVGVRVVWTLHNLYTHDSGHQDFEKRFVKNVARISTRIIIHSRGAETAFNEEFGKKHSHKMVCIPHGNYISVYPQTISREDSRDRLGIRNEKVVLFFGNIKPYKGIDFLVNEFRKIDLDNVRLLIVGKPDNKNIADEIKNSAKLDPRIQMIFQYIEENDVQLYFNASDIVVFPYRDILTSGAVILAMSFGKPCIVVEKGCMLETLHAEGGVSYSNEEEGALSRALQKMLKKDNYSLVKMGEKNYREVERLNWDMIARKTTESYEMNIYS